LAVPLRMWLDTSPAVVVSFLAAGGMLGPVALLPAWLVWGSRPLPQRLAFAVIFTVYFHLLWWASLVLAGIRDVQLAVTILLLVPAISLSIAAPLALVRDVFRWRIATPNCPPPPPLGIRHLLIVTALVAGALGLIRLAHRIAAQSSDEFWLDVSIVCGVSILVSLVMLIPLVWLTLGLRNSLVGALFVGILAIGGATALLAVGSILEIPPTTHFFVGIYLFSLSVTYTTSAGFWLARRAGYRLEIGRVRHNAIDDAEPL
jgi:hypothetical protein